MLNIIEEDRIVDQLVFDELWKPIQECVLLKFDRSVEKSVVQKVWDEVYNPVRRRVMPLKEHVCVIVQVN